MTHLRSCCSHAALSAWGKARRQLVLRREILHRVAVASAGATVLVVLTAVSAAAEDVRFATRDGVELAGTFYAAPASPAPAVLLLHGLGQNRQGWDPFARLLQREGMAVLAVDLRAHGESVKQQTAQGLVRLDVSAFRPNDFQNMLIDINTAYDWLADREGVDHQRIGIAGASLSANLAARYAVFNEDVAALVLFSPGLRYREVRADDAIIELGDVPLRIYVGVNDSFAYESSKKLVELRREGGKPFAEDTLIVCTGSLHGAQLLQGVDGLAQQIAGWLKQTLASKPAP